MQSGGAHHFVCPFCLSTLGPDECPCPGFSRLFSILGGNLSPISWHAINFAGPLMTMIKWQERGVGREDLVSKTGTKGGRHVSRKVAIGKVPRLESIKI